MRIENWAVISPVPGPYTAPETQGSPSLSGNVFDHPRFNDGTWVTTSFIIGKNNKDEIITNSGSSYELGQVSQPYEEKFPDARNKLLKSLA